MFCFAGAVAFVVLVAVTDLEWWRAVISSLVLLDSGVQLWWVSFSGTVIDQDAVQVRPFGGVRRRISMEDIAVPEPPIKWNPRLQVLLVAGDRLALPHTVSP